MQHRLHAIQAALPPHSALLVESAANRFYLTGFRSSAGFILLSRDKAAFYVDFRYTEKAKHTIRHCPVYRSERPMQEIRAFLTEQGVTTLFVETDSTSVARMRTLRDALDGVTVTDEDTFDRLIEQMRQVKAPAEIAAVRQAQRLTDDTFSYILDRIAAGRTEREIMLDMEYYIRRLGSDGVAFDFIVVSGKNSSVPHGTPTDKPLETGDFVTMDFGGAVDGYRADMTRTVAIGAVSEEQRRVYDTVLTAQKAALTAIRADLVCKDVDKIARDIINAAGYEGCFGHGLGHSVGIEIHETPSLSPRCDATLKPGVVMTVEPGIYLEGRFGVRIEDMVVITENGCENFTKSRKDLILL